MPCIWVKSYSGASNPKRAVSRLTLQAHPQVCSRNTGCCLTPVETPVGASRPRQSTERTRLPRASLPTPPPPPRRSEPAPRSPGSRVRSAGSARARTPHTAAMQCADETSVHDQGHAGQAPPMPREAVGPQRPGGADLSVSYVVMFLCTLRLPSCRPGPMPFYASANQLTAGQQRGGARKAAAESGGRRGRRR